VDNHTLTTILWWGGWFVLLVSCTPPTAPAVIELPNRVCTSYDSGVLVNDTLVQTRHCTPEVK